MVGRLGWPYVVVSDQPVEELVGIGAGSLQSDGGRAARSSVSGPAGTRVCRCLGADCLAAGETRTRPAPWVPLDAPDLFDVWRVVRRGQGSARTNPMPDIEQPIRDLQLPPDPPRWRSRVKDALRSLGGVASLQAIYQAVQEQYPEAIEHRHWQAKVRQVLRADSEIQRGPDGDSKWRLCPLCADSYELKEK